MTSEPARTDRSIGMVLLKTVLAIFGGFYTNIKVFNWLDVDKWSTLSIMGVGLIGAIIGWFIPDLFMLIKNQVKHRID